MFSTNHKISDSQIKKMLVFDLCSVSILIIPGITAAGAGRDGLISIILGSLAALAYIGLLLYFSHKIDGDYLHYSQAHAGKTATFIFGVLYIIKLMFSCIFTLTLFAKVIQETLLPHTSYSAVVFTLVLVGVYSASKGIEVRARTAEILFYIVMIPLFILFLLGLGKVDAANIFPLFTESGSDILRSGYLVLLTYSSAEIVMFAAPMLVGKNEHGRRTRNVMQAILIAAALNILVFIVVIGLLSHSGAGSQLLSSVSVLQELEIPGGFIQRQDAVILIFWLLSIFTIISTCFYYMGKITNDLFPVKKKGFYLAAYAVLIFFTASQTFSLDALTKHYGRYLAYIGFPQSILIPLIIIIIGKRKKHEKEVTDDV